MAISLASLRRGGEARPPRLLIYGVAGVGKTKLAADAPSPVFLQTEDGLGGIDAATFGLLRSFDVMAAIASLYTEPHDFQTVVLDFAGVDEIGQAFADEVFRVFQLAHPQTTLLPQNLSPAVAAMVSRARALGRSS